MPVAYRNIAIHPDTARVKVGSVVRWTNYDPVEHNVTSHGAGQHIASGNFGEGKTFSVRLTRPGVIHYTCTIHPATMNGTIEGRAADRANKLLDQIPPGGRKRYQYTIEVVTTPAALKKLLSLNR